MSGGEPSSIKRKPSCAAELPILSPNRGKAAGRTRSNRPRAVLWGAERISLETTVSSEWDVPGRSPDPSERDKSSDERNFCFDWYKNPRARPRPPSLGLRSIHLVSRVFMDQISARCAEESGRAGLLMKNTAPLCFLIVLRAWRAERTLGGGLAPASFVVS